MLGWGGGRGSEKVGGIWGGNSKFTKQTAFVYLLSTGSEQSFIVP